MVMGRGGDNYNVAIKFLVNTDDLRRGVSVVGRELGMAERDTNELTRAVGRLDREASDTSGLRRQQREVRDLGREADSTRGRLGALASGIAALAGGFAVGGLLAGGFDRLRELRQVQVDNPSLDAEAAQRLTSGARGAGLDEGRLADALYEGQVRAQEGLSGINQSIRDDFAALGLDFERYANSLIDAASETERLRIQTDLLASVPIDQRLALAEAAFGGAGQSVALMANNTELATRVFEGMDNAVVQSANDLNRLADAQAAMQQLTDTLSILAGEFAAGLTPAIQVAADVLGGIRNAFSALNNVIPGSGTLIAVGAGVAAIGLAAAATIAPLFGMAAAGIAAFAPFAPFIAIGVGVVAAIAGIVVGVNWLADQVGGFGNLWATVWDGVVIAAVTAIQAILAPLGILIEALNAVGRGVSLISGGAISVPRIENPVLALGAERDRRLANIGERRRERGGGGDIVINQTNNIAETGNGAELAGYIAERNVQSLQIHGG